MFIIILILTTLSIAGSAAFFTMYGLAQMFTSAFLPVVIAGGTIEVGKLVVASYLYRYWNHIRWFLKPFYLTVLFGAMLFTSIGIFGYLSASYQRDVLPLEEIHAKVEILNEKSVTLENLKDEALLQQKRLIDEKSNEIAALPPNYATKKKEVSDRYQVELVKLAENVDTYNLQLRTLLDKKEELKITTINQETKSGPIVFIAEAFGWQTDDAVKWLILLIVTIFDPMAVLLAVAANVVLVERMTHKRRRVDDRVHILEEALETAEKQPEPEKTNTDETIPANMSVEDIKDVIESMSQRRLSRVENQQKQMFEEILARKTLTDQIRNPKNKG